MQKLELTWVDKGNDPKPEPRILLQQSEHDYGDAGTGNMIIHGDNLLALKALEQEYAGKVKCIYIDPPYNTGNAFEHYDDNREHSIWLNLMKPRLEILRNLLSDEGSIFIQIDDEEQAYLKVLCDEIFGRRNFVNLISVNMKNIAGASGGGEDKRLKKNCEFILVYAKNYDNLPLFHNSYTYTEISELVQQYRDNGVSWKYTAVLKSSGNKVYVGSTVDGSGDEIKIYKRENYEFTNISSLMKQEGLSEKEAYQKYAKQAFQTAMPQSSIRPRVLEKVKEMGFESDLYSIEYTPRSGKNKGQLYEQFYKGESFRLFAWLRDVTEEIDGELYKKDPVGTYWDFAGETKNLTKEGSVVFPQGKKPEKLVSRIIEMTTQEGDLVLDSFLGSGTTAAVAQKMNRRYIGIELGEQAYTHAIPRLQKVIDGTDQGGISKFVNWQGGGGYKFYTLAPTLIVKDEHGFEIISDQYNPEMLAAAVAKLCGYSYSPSETNPYSHGQNGAGGVIFVTTGYIDAPLLATIARQFDDGQRLLICASAFQPGIAKTYSNITLRKIPQTVLDKCEYGKDNYDLNVVAVDDFEDEGVFEDAE